MRDSKTNVFKEKIYLIKNINYVSKDSKESDRKNNDEQSEGSNIKKNSENIVTKSNDRYFIAIGLVSTFAILISKMYSPLLNSIKDIYISWDKEFFFKPLQFMAVVVFLSIVFIVLNLVWFCYHEAKNLVMDNRNKADKLLVAVFVSVKMYFVVNLSYFIISLICVCFNVFSSDVGLFWPVGILIFSILFGFLCSVMTEKKIRNILKEHWAILFLEGIFFVIAFLMTLRFLIMDIQVNQGELVAIYEKNEIKITYEGSGSIEKIQVNIEGGNYPKTVSLDKHSQTLYMRESFEKYNKGNNKEYIVNVDDLYNYYAETIDMKADMERLKDGDYEVMIDVYFKDGVLQIRNPVNKEGDKLEYQKTEYRKIFKK